MPRAVKCKQCGEVINYSDAYGPFYGPGGIPCRCSPVEEDTDAALARAGHQIEQLQKRIAELERMLEREAFISAKPKTAMARARAEERERCIAIVEDSRSVEEMVKRIRALEDE